MGIKDTKTFENLKMALAGESIARNKYTYFAAAARANGNEDIAVAFEEMAKNEMTHARFWFEQIYGKPTSTEECLLKAAQGEYEEWHRMYPEFAKQAREDGLEQLAIMFEHVAAIEKHHEQQFMKLFSNLKQGSASVSVEEHEEKTGYRCQFCGAVFDNRPDVCEVCQAIGAFDFIKYTT